jgi:hypothetical protein
MTPMQKVERVLTEALEEVERLDKPEDMGEHLVVQAVSRGLSMLREDVRVFIDE